MGKGSNRRNEDLGKIWDNWDAIFNKDKPAEEPVKEIPPQQEVPKQNAK